MELGITHAQHLSEEARAAYRLGIVDGWSNHPPVGAATRCPAWYRAGYRVGQVLLEELLPILPVLLDLAHGQPWIVSE